jgi:hypothetical protein
MALREVQKELAGWIRAPEGVAVALAEEDRASGGPASGAAIRRLEGLIRSDATLDATGRLEIYANAYFHRILGVLSSDYPALEQALGRDPFSDLVTSYLLVEPSRHPSLRYAGSRLADFLSAHAAAAGIRARAPWAFELAVFEWARVDVFDVTDGVVLTAASLASLAPEEFGSQNLRLGPWARLRSFEYPVDQIWAAANRGEEIDPELAASTTNALVWRKEEAVLHRRVEQLEEAALALVGSGIRFDELCEWTATEIGESEAPAQAAGWLGQWVADGLLVVPEPDAAQPITAD